jgi:predicted TIM-barrel fold metal-dependent hydrolase
VKIIDFHTHLDARWFKQTLPTPSDFVAAMDRHGVQVSCVFTLMGLYGDCPRHNDELVARAGAYPGRLLPFATVDPKLGRAAEEELERRLSDPLFRGVKFHPWLQAFSPSMARKTLTALLECAAHYKAPVVFHDGTPPYSTPFQVAAAARWVPQATVVLGHGGLADYVLPAADLVRDVPNLYLCYSGPKAGELPYLVRTTGADKILFGSDSGLSDWKSLAERLDDVHEAGIEERDLEKILYQNAARLLGFR